MTHQPDGMATMAAERDHMRELRNTPGPEYLIVAVDSDGTILYEADAVYSFADAEDTVREFNDAVDLPKETGHGLVAGFEHVEA